MKSATEIVEQAISKIDSEEIPPKEDPKVDPPAEDPNDDPKKSEDKKDDKKPELKYDKDGKRVDGEDKDPEVPEDKKQDEGEFTAEDGLEVEEKTPETPSEDAAGISLSPNESKYVADNIGEPLQITGMRGDKEVTIKAFTANDIPTDFKFSSDAQMAATLNSFSRLETKAQQLLGNYRAQQSQTEAQAFEQRENEGIRQDVAELQKDGAFPKFKLKPGERGFDDTAEAKQMSEVLKIMTDRNEQYLKEYQQGRPYRHIGFREAHELYTAKKPESKQKVEQDKEDVEREKVADKVGGNRGLSASKLQKATVRSGTSIADIVDRIDAEDW